MVKRENRMTETQADADAEAVKGWYTTLLDQVVKEMIRLKAIKGVAVQASPVWMVPNQILMAKVWGVGHENDFVWAISIDKLIADYVAGSLASTPREVARHFSMKWQMDADRILSHEKSKAPPRSSDAKMQAYSKQLIQHAEALYDLTNQDEAWQDLQPIR